MRSRRQTDATPPEQEIAVGLVWGHLNARQHEDALDLADSCLALWPACVPLQLMRDFAAAELLEPVDQARLRSLHTPQTASWVDLVLRRLQQHRSQAVG